MKRAAKTTAWPKFLLGAATTQKMWSYFTDAPQSVKTAVKVRFCGTNGAESVHFLIVSDRTAVWRDIILPLLPPLLPADRLRQDGRQKRKHPPPSALPQPGPTSGKELQNKSRILNKVNFFKIMCRLLQSVRIHKFKPIPIPSTISQSKQLIVHIAAITL